MKRALKLLLLFVCLAPGFVQAQLIRREFIDPLLGPSIAYSALPGSPRTGDTYWVSDVNTACTTGGSTNNVIVGWTGTAWICLGSVGAGAGSQSMTQVLAIGRTDSTLVSEATALQLGDGTRRVDFWCDATDGCVRKPNPLADTVIPIWTNFNFRIRDIERLVNVAIVDPDDPGGFVLEAECPASDPTSAAAGYLKIYCKSGVWYQKNSAGTVAPLGASDISVSVYNNITQGVNTGVETTIGFNSERFDTDTMHDTVTNNGRITFTTAGKYEIKANICIDNTDLDGARFYSLRVNGTNYIANDIVDSSVNFSRACGTLSKIYNAAAADYVEVRVEQSSGSTLNIYASDTGVTQYGSEFMAHKIN